MEDFEKAAFLDESWCDIVEFGNADCGSFADVGVFISKSTREGITEVFRDTIDADAPHGSYCQRTDERVGVRCVLHKGIDGKECKFRLGFGVVDEVEVDELLEFDVSRLDAVEDVSEQHRDVLADRHGGNYFLDSVDFGVAVGRV